VGACHQDDVPPTPVTPVSAEGLVSLQNLIKQDAHILNEASIPRLERHVQKLANAALVSLADRTFLSAKYALLDDRNKMLTKMNNEAKVRRSTKSLVLGQGQGKVMSFEDIEEARAARAVKDAKVKGKRGRKRKSDALEVGEPEPELEAEPDSGPEVARAAKEVIKGKGKRSQKRKSAAQEAEELEPEVARMI